MTPTEYREQLKMIESSWNDGCRVGAVMGSIAGAVIGSLVIGLLLRFL